jgi:hypothetical protein
MYTSIHKYTEFEYRIDQAKRHRDGKDDHKKQRLLQPNSNHPKAMRTIRLIAYEKNCEMSFEYSCHVYIIKAYVCMYVCMYACMYLWMYVRGMYDYLNPLMTTSMHVIVWTPVCMYVLVLVCMHVYVCKHVCKYVCIYVCVCVFKCACIY